MNLTFSVASLDDSETRIEFPVRRVILCGMTGPTEEVERHVAELEKEGIPVPDELPAMFPSPRHCLVVGTNIDVLSAKTSGEIEYVLLPTEDEVYVGVASDHTDRALETEDIPLSKAVCPNVVSDTVWKLSEIEDHWDTLELQSRTGTGGEYDTYQEGTLDQFMGPRELLDLVAERTGESLEGTVVLSGTLSTTEGQLVYGDHFVGTLRDPVTDRSLTVEYDVSVLDETG